MVWNPQNNRSSQDHVLLVPLFWPCTKTASWFFSSTTTMYCVRFRAGRFGGHNGTLLNIYVRRWCAGQTTRSLSFSSLLLLRVACVLTVDLWTEQTQNKVLVSVCCTGLDCYLQFTKSSSSSPSLYNKRKADFFQRNFAPLIRCTLFRFRCPFSFLVICHTHCRRRASMKCKSRRLRTRIRTRGFAIVCVFFYKM